MLFGDIQTLFLINVDDTRQDKWSDSQMNLLLWEAVDDLVARIEEAEPSYFVTSVTFTHTASTTAIDLAVISGVDITKFRKIVLLEKLNSGGQGENINILSLSNMNDGVISGPYIQENYNNLSKTVFFNKNTLEFRTPPTEDWSMKLYFTEDLPFSELSALATNTEFVFLPARFHSIIALSAAVAALTAENATRSRIDPLESRLQSKLLRVENLGTDRQLQQAESGRYIGDNE